MPDHVSPGTGRRLREAGLVWCACGCGQLLEDRDAKGRPRRFIHGHNARLLVSPPPHKVTPLEERVWARVDKSGECWIWTGTRYRRGYGSIWVAGRHKPVHRVVWELVNGPIPTDLQVCHHCDNPPCVRPDHLFLGTRSDNTIDCVRKGRHKSPWSTHKTHCKHGHPFNEANTYWHHGGRHCRACARDRKDARKLRQPQESTSPAEALAEVWLRVKAQEVRA